VGGAHHSDAPVFCKSEVSSDSSYLDRESPIARLVMSADVTRLPSPSRWPLVTVTLAFGWGFVYLTLRKSLR